MHQAGRLALLVFMAAGIGFPATGPASPVAPTAIDRAFSRMYVLDFSGAEAILDSHLSKSPSDPLGYAARAAALLFSELSRMRLLESGFLANDKRLQEKIPRIPADPQVRTRLTDALRKARESARARLATQRSDADALFTLALSAGVETDYLALVAKEHFAALKAARESQTWALKLLAAHPNYHDAHLTTGFNEYLVSSLPFFVRWFVRFDQVQGKKEMAVQKLTKAAQNGRYLAPFAKLTLALLHIREKNTSAAVAVLADFSREFPENVLIRRELARLSGMLESGRAGVAAQGESGRAMP